MRLCVPHMTFGEPLSYCDYMFRFQVYFQVSLVLMPPEYEMWVFMLFFTFLPQKTALVLLTSKILRCV